MNSAHIYRLMTFAEHGQPKDYGGSDMMRNDLDALIDVALSGIAIRAAIRDDGFAASFLTMGAYRNALLAKEVA